MLPDHHDEEYRLAKRANWLMPALAVALGAMAGTICLSLSAAAGSAPARPDTRATSSYLSARQLYVRHIANDAHSAELAQDAVAKAVTDACPGILRGAPRNAMTRAFVREILGVVTLVGKRASVAAQVKFSQEVVSLRWSDHRIAAMIAELVSARRQVLRIPMPSICPDARAWAASRFSTLAPSTLSFTARLGSRQLTFRAAEGRHTLEATINERLEPYENRNLRTQAKRLERGPSPHGGGRTAPWVAIIDSLGIYEP